MRGSERSPQSGASNCASKTAADNFPIDFYGPMGIIFRMGTKIPAFGRILFFAAFAICASAHAWGAEAAGDRAASDFSVNWGLGSLRLGGMFPFGAGASGFAASVSVLEIGIEHSGANLGMAFSPFSISAWGNESRPTEVFSILNLFFYWNALSHRGIFFGPFASANYLFFGDAFYPGKHVFAAGLRGGLRKETGITNMHFVSVEAGFRLVDGRSNFFVGAAIDLLPIFASQIARGWWRHGNIHG